MDYSAFGIIARRKRPSRVSVMGGRESRVFDLNALLIFAEVVDAGSFVGAARNLDEPIATVSRKIRQLETALAARLLHRTTRAISLTDAGRQVYQEACRMRETAAAIRALTDAHRQEPQGRLRVTAPTSFANGMLGDWLIEYRLRYPGVDVDLLASNAMLDFQEHQLDFAIRAGKLRDSSLVARRISAARFGLFAAPQLLAGRPPIAGKADLDGCPCIAATFDGHALPWILRHDGVDETYQPNGALRAEDHGLLQRAALRGLGIAYLPLALVQDDVAHGRLVPVLEACWGPPYDLYLVYPARDHLSAKSRSFIDFISVKFAALDAAG